MPKKPKAPQKELFLTGSICDLALEYLKELKEIDGYPYLKNRFKNIESAYMRSIISSFSVVFSFTSSDKVGINNAIKICKHFNFNETCVELEELKSKYEKLLNKLKSNRNRVVVHLSVDGGNQKHSTSFEEMGLSEREVNRLENVYSNSNESGLLKGIEKPDYKKLQASEVKNERYSTTDFIEDIPELEKCLKEYIGIISKIRFELFSKRGNDSSKYQ